MSSNMDSQGFRKKWATDRKKPAMKYTSKAKSQETALANTHKEADRTTGIAETLRRPFQIPRTVAREDQSRGCSSQDRPKSKSRTPKSDRTSEDEENRPAKVKSPSYSSDEEDDKRMAQNDIPQTGWESKKEQPPKRALKVGSKEWIESTRVKFSESASPETEDIPSASQRSLKSSSQKADALEPVRARKQFKHFTLSQTEESEEDAKPASKFVKPELTASPERENKTKKAFFKPEIEDDPENDDKRKKEAARRLAILREVGAESNKAKRTLQDLGFGEGLEIIKEGDTCGSPPKKIATASQGLSSLAARIASRRIKKEEKEEKEDDTEDFIELDDETSCPMCHEVVPEVLLMAFSNNRPRSLNTRQQAAFCVHHKRSSALTTYTSLGYPNIPWDTFTSRLASHYTYISSLITSPETTTSHYRPLFASDITHGRNRTIKQSILGNTGLGSDTARVLIPGYYGPRGARAMQEAILLKFNRELRKAAVEDNVVSARAVGGYVASVLVPELGTRLIMEDLKIPEEAARGVMEKSAALGSLVNEEVKDVRSDADKWMEEGGDYD